MNVLDIIIVAAMAFLIVRGLFRGFFREIASLAGIVLGILLAIQYQPQVTEYLKGYLPSGKYLPLISFVVIFVIVFLACNLAGWGLKILSKKASLGWADRTLGIGLALLKGVIITYLVIVLLTFFVPSQTPLIARSKLAPLIITSYQSMVGLISPGSYQRWKRKFSGEKKGMDEERSPRPRGFTGKDGSR
jgi:membrane protein required for colicin V production